jgi:hypothetical protein
MHNATVIAPLRVSVDRYICKMHDIKGYSLRSKLIDAALVKFWKQSVSTKAV